MTQIHPLTVLTYTITLEMIGIGAILITDPTHVRYRHIAEITGYGGIFLWGIWMVVCATLLLSAYTRQRSLMRPTRALTCAGNLAGLTFLFLLVAFGLEAKGFHPSHVIYLPAAFTAYYLASCGCPIISGTRMCQSVMDRLDSNRRVPSE